ncbi:MAG: CDP-alcohol phosphatidyltransferase family protein [bacterium]
MAATILTAGNLVCGFAAILLVTLPGLLGWGSPQLETAVWCLAAAGVLDAADGPVARRFGTPPAPWGRQFDALADLVSFGLAPVLLLGSAMPASWNHLMAAGGVLYILAGAWRLARFLWTADRMGPGRFQGLPITGAGLALAAFWLFEAGRWGTLTHPAAGITLLGGSAVLMVSRVPYRKFPAFGGVGAGGRVLAAAAVAAITLRPSVMGLVVAVTYMMYAPILAGVNALRGSESIPSE